MFVFFYLFAIISFFSKETESSSASSSGASSAAALASPIRHWDASWTASCAQGTAIAMSCQDCLLLFIRSPSSNVWKPSLVPPNDRPEDEEDNLLGLPVVCLQDPSTTTSATKHTQVHFAPSWLSFSNALCAMTGLASDVEHLARILQRQVDNYWNVYNKPLTTHDMTARVSRVLQHAAQSKGGRPFGVQMLLVGTDDIDAADRKLCVYTIDPSGSWQSWVGGATAIGKYAKQVRQQLAKSLHASKPDEATASSATTAAAAATTTTTTSSSSAKDSDDNTALRRALERVVECWIETCQQEHVDAKAEDDYQVLILQKTNEMENPNGRMYMVNPENVRTIVEEARKDRLRK